MGLLGKLLWVALFAAFTFVFVILFEHGSKDFVKDFSKNAQTEYAALQTFTAPTKVRSSDGTTK